MSKVFTIEEMKQLADELGKEVHLMYSKELPNLDLYMDQVTTYLEEQLGKLTRRPGEDKILTKTMINNYAKADLLIPPVKKKYSDEHLLLLIYIYMFKNFLSISDVATIIDPIKKACFTEGQITGKAQKDENAEEPPLQFAAIYDEIRDLLSAGKKEMEKNLIDEVSTAEEAFKDADPEYRCMLQQFAAICLISSDIYIRKLFLERIIDGWDAEAGEK